MFVFVCMGLYATPIRLGLPSTAYQITHWKCVSSEQIRRPFLSQVQITSFTYWTLLLQRTNLAIVTLLPWNIFSFSFSSLAQWRIELLKHLDTRNVQYICTYIKKRYGLLDVRLTLDWTEWYWHFTIISVCHLYIGGQKCSFVPFFSILAVKHHFWDVFSQ